MARTVRSRMQPLRLRIGARFECNAGGGCCSSIHRLGPVSFAEAERLNRLWPGLVERSVVGGQLHLKVDGSGRCVALVEGRCSLHEQHGSGAKPIMCRRFPYGLVATPLGGRVVTSHRCGCRSMGNPPPIDEEVAKQSLCDDAGQFILTGEAPVLLRLHDDDVVDFVEYERIEHELLCGLLECQPPPDVLGLAPTLPQLHGTDWADVAQRFTHLPEQARGSAWAHAVVLFAEALMVLDGAPRFVETEPRPWQNHFDQLEAEREPKAPEFVLADWLADVLWGLAWTRRGTLVLGLVEMTTLWLAAMAITDRLIRAGARPDRAAAEAVMI